ncbi:MAG: lysine biosynthesis protein LysW [Planctomycetota bacterium]
MSSATPPAASAATPSTATSTACPVCGSAVDVPSDVLAGEVLACDDCGAELEVTSLEPLTLAEAPEVDEDWGE